MVDAQNENSTLTKKIKMAEQKMREQAFQMEHHNIGLHVDFSQRPQLDHHNLTLHKHQNIELNHDGTIKPLVFVLV